MKGLVFVKLFFRVDPIAARIRRMYNVHSLNHAVRSFSVFRMALGSALLNFGVHNRPTLPVAHTTCEEWTENENVLPLCLCVGAKKKKKTTQHTRITTIHQCVFDGQ
mmetsp:Transcript_4919/g.12247  ORF Transcript_4919/g.12247 Transcript_4919/m.12247 type:complete len:107 (+) Transcript_4919:1733-2053(+)